MQNPKAVFLGLALTLALSSLAAAPASASGVALLAGANATVDASGSAAIAIGHRRHYDDDYKKVHKKHRRHRRGSDIHFGWYGGFYDPFYYRPYYYDPFYDPFYYDPYYYPRYYDAPVYSKRLSCDKARRRLGQNGYRNVKALDCSGKTYAFSAVKGKKHYRIKVSARNGHIISRTPY